MARKTDERVVAVVVAWNRQELLARTLAAVAAQTRPVDAAVVVDNASTDGSGAVAAAHPLVSEVVTMPRNTGGAGGFAGGIARAIEGHGADLVWVMDDDTIPSKNALVELLTARASYPGGASLVASRADWHDGREHPMNTPRRRRGAPREQWTARGGERQIRSASFVSILIEADGVRSVGLPIADYFIWNDDFEFTARLLRHRVGLYAPRSRVQHLTKVFGDGGVDPGPRFYNEVRNKLWALTRSDAFGPVDRVLYGGATVARWLRTLATSPDRGALLRFAGSGLRAALTPPRSTTVVLADTPVACDVSRIERQADRG